MTATVLFLVAVFLAGAVVGAGDGGVVLWHRWRGGS